MLLIKILDNNKMYKLMNYPDVILGTLQKTIFALRFIKPKQISLNVSFVKIKKQKC